VTDTENGCVGFDTVTLTILPPGLYAFPNSFTPNGDGNNDYFKPYFPSGATVDFGYLRIYNQWGQLVYECTGCDFTITNSGWDGKLNGVSQPNGTYYYSAQVLTPNSNDPNVNDSFIAGGVLTLIK
jgi:gliding motility-associated-like protein